jgi:hypothetical protein
MGACSGLIIAFGVALIVIGLVGRAKAIAPRCAFCGFDRSMLSDPSGRCPECGADGTVEGAVRSTARMPDLRRSLSGCGLLLVGLLLWITHMAVGRLPLMPTWWLVRVEHRLSQEEHRTVIEAELARRVVTGRASWKDFTSIARDTLDEIAREGDAPDGRRSVDRPSDASVGFAMRTARDSDDRHTIEALERARLARARISVVPELSLDGDRASCILIVDPLRVLTTIAPGTTTAGRGRPATVDVVAWTIDGVRHPVGLRFEVDLAATTWFAFDGITVEHEVATHGVRSGSLEVELSFASDSSSSDADQPAVRLMHRSIHVPIEVPIGAERLDLDRARFAERFSGRLDVAWSERPSQRGTWGELRLSRSAPLEQIPGLPIDVRARSPWIGTGESLRLLGIPSDARSFWGLDTWTWEWKGLVAELVRSPIAGDPIDLAIERLRLVDWSVLRTASGAELNEDDIDRLGPNPIISPQDLVVRAAVRTRR